MQSVVSKMWTPTVLMGQAADFVFTESYLKRGAILKQDVINTALISVNSYLNVGHLIIPKRTYNKCTFETRLRQSPYSFLHININSFSSRRWLAPWNNKIKPVHKYACIPAAACQAVKSICHSTTTQHTQTTASWLLWTNTNCQGRSRASAIL